MAKLTIPARYRDGLAALLRLDDIQAQSLSIAVERMTPSISASEFSTQTLIANVEPSTVAQIFETLQSLYRVRQAENASPELFTDRILDAMGTSDDDRLSFVEEKRDAIRKRLVRLLSAQQFATAAKAWDLSRDFERTLCTAKVITDLRPVFTDDATETPVGFMVINTLKLDFHAQSDHSTVYVGLSEEDLRHLKDALTRALDKCETLRSKIAAAGIGHIDGRNLQ